MQNNWKNRNRNCNSFTIRRLNPVHQTSLFIATCCGVVAGALFLSNCASQTKTDVKQKELPAIADKELDAEIILGREMAALVMARTEPVNNPTLSAYVNEVGNYIAQNSAYSSRKFMFEVLADENVNAFACPGGYVFVTLGAIKAAENEAELASILSHEIAHVGNRHVIQALQQKDFSKETEAKKSKKTPAEITARQRPTAEVNELGKLVSQNLLGPGSGGVSLLQAADASMNILLTKGLDKKLEFHADAEGAKIMAQAGYDAKAMSAYFSRLRANSAQKPSLAKPKNASAPSPSVLESEKTHPKFLDRESALFEVFKSDPVFGTKGAFGQKRFANVKKMLSSENFGSSTTRIEK